MAKNSIPIKKAMAAIAQVLGFLLLIFLVLVILAIPTKLLFGEQESHEPRMQILFLGVHILIAVVVVTAAMAGIGKSKLAWAGWPNIRSSLRWFGIGTVVGLMLAGIMIAIPWLAGGGTFGRQSGGLSDYLRYVLPLVCFLAVAALGEEWIFRGYPMTKMSQSMGQWQTNVFISLLFMAGHWGGNGWCALAAVNIFLFSLVNGTMRFTPGGIPAAWGFHFAWNSLQVIVGANLTGETFPLPVIRFQSQGPAWLSGGAFGPEGGLGATIAALAGLFCLWIWKQRRMKTGTRVVDG